MNHQNDYGVLCGLDLISQALGDPFGSYVLHIEPRAISGEEVTAWDLRIEPPARQVEVKLNPSKEDVLEFLARAAKALTTGGRAEYRLVYGQDKPFLGPLKQLLRLAKEAQGDADGFRFRLTLEGADGTEKMLEWLGDTAHDVLRWVTLEQHPEESLAREIRRSATQLAGSDGAQRLYDLLFRKIAKAVPDRASLSARELIEEARRVSIQLNTPTDVNPPGVSPRVRSALFVLQAAPDGLPPNVIAQALGCLLPQIEGELTPYLEKGFVRAVDELWRIEPIPETLAHPDAESLLAHALEALLDSTQRHPTSPASLAQIGNILRLAGRCANSRPKPVARVFSVLHKALKSLGDKRRMLEVARLSIDAARCVGPDRPEEFVKLEAQALICGESWVYQRIGRLKEALAAAEKSLQLGEGIRWWRNTTFCRKCIGRLHRLEAEACKDPKEKARLLQKSVALLEDAIARFSSTEDGGPHDLEVGDCYSLLGRTYFVMKEFGKALKAVYQADELLTERADKDYLDLLILWGELVAAQGDRAEAENLLCEALAVPVAGDAEKTEMRARAYFQRARNRQALGQKEDAVADYRRAAEIWRGVDEQSQANKAEWHSICLTESQTVAFRELPPSLQSEPFGVRLRVLQKRKTDLMQLPGSFRGRRTPPGENYWKRLIADAHKDEARGKIDW